MEVLSDVLPDIVAHIGEETSSPFTNKTQRLVENKNGSLLLWSESSKCLYATSSSTSSLKNVSYQTLIPSISPLFQITSLKCSNLGAYALLFGSNGIGFIDLPKKWGNDGRFEGGKSTCHCRFDILDESYFTHSISTKIIQVSWYPGSPNESHVLALTSDNCLRFYDITMPEQPMMRLHLFGEVGKSVPCGSIGSFASVTGETAVDFDVAQPSTDEFGVSTYPIYVMQECGDVWSLHCKFTQNRLVVEMQGPLTMNPPAQDNYGCNYCSILCLPSTPTVLALATQGGTIYHCLVLENQQGDGSYGDFSTIVDVPPGEALYVYESIQLDLNWVSTTIQDEESQDELLVKPNNLYTLRMDNNSYISVSEGGIHHVALPWLQDLSRFLLPVVASNDVDIQTPEGDVAAEISYLLCTSPYEESPSVTVCGCQPIDFSTDSIVLVLLSTGEIMHLRLKSYGTGIWSGFDDISHTKSEKYTSPLRKLHACGGFDHYIKKILTKNCTVPLLRSGGYDGQMIPADAYYKLLTKTTQVLHEEYIQKMIQAKLELQKRCKILKSKKEEQQKEIILLQANSKLIEKGDELAVKLETAQENMQSLFVRVEKVLHTLQKSAPILSNEEEEWGRELKAMQNRLINLKRKSEVVKTKHENEVLQSTPHRAGNHPKNTSSLSATNAVKFRAILKDQGATISKLIEDVENMKLQVGTR